MLHQPRGQRLHHKLHLQRCRQELQQINIRLSNVFLLSIQLVLHKPQDAYGQPCADHPVAQVLPQYHQALVILESHLAKLRHGRCQAGDEGREDNQCEDEHDDGKEPLVDVPWDDLHTRRCELCQAPVQTRQICIGEIGRFPELGTQDPSINALRGKIADAIPRTSDDVVATKNEDDVLCDATRETQVLRIDAVHHVLEDLLELSEPNQAKGLDEPDHAQGLAHARQGGGAAAEGEPPEEIRGDHEHVEQEPGFQVPRGDLAGTHLLGAPGVEARAERHGHVATPIDQREPELDLQERRLLGLEGELDGDREQVEGDKHRGDHVPKQAPRRTGPEHTAGGRQRGILLLLLHQERPSRGI
mmetsp:Transcript_121097/g.387705  ORF Transcript_121097/g.387705 Transcript_121097/m.387705 type:complete len:359 (+) Transcript_121097:633-1709(+)